MIDLPFRFPWRVALRCALAGYPGAMGLAVSADYIRSTSAVWEPVFRTVSVVSVGWTLVIVTMLRILLGRSARVWRTLPVAVLLNPLLLILAINWLRLRPLIYALAGYQRTGVPPEAIEIFLLLVPVFLVSLLGHGGLCLVVVRPRPSPTQLLGATLWLFVSTLVFWRGITAFLLPTHFQTIEMTNRSEAILFGSLLWLQAFWIGLPWLLAEARGDEVIAASRDVEPVAEQGNAG